jgi:hypothetical protein
MDQRICCRIDFAADLVGERGGVRVAVPAVPVGVSEPNAVAAVPRDVFGAGDHWRDHGFADAANFVPCGGGAGGDCDVVFITNAYISAGVDVGLGCGLAGVVFGGDGA